MQICEICRRTRVGLSQPSKVYKTCVQVESMGDVCARGWFYSVLFIGYFMRTGARSPQVIYGQRIARHRHLHPPGAGGGADSIPVSIRTSALMSVHSAKPSRPRRKIFQLFKHLNTLPAPLITVDMVFFSRPAITVTPILL